MGVFLPNLSERVSYTTGDLWFLSEYKHETRNCLIVLFLAPYLEFQLNEIIRSNTLTGYHVIHLKYFLN